MREPCTVALVLILVCVVSASARTGPDGKIRVFCYGDVIEQYGSFNSYAVIGTDPAIDTTLVPTRPGYLGGVENAKRNLRIYMPRTYDQMANGYELILTSDADRTVFKTDWIVWMARSVTEGGLGFEWLGSIGRPPSQEQLDWVGTPLAEFAPSYTSDEYYKYGSFRVKIVDRDEELMKALPWESAPPLANLDMQIPKQGSQVWAITDHPRGYPLITYWGVGEGSVLCFASKFPNGVMPWADDWPLFPQAMIYLAYRTSGRALPEDHLAFHEIMSLFFEYKSTTTVIGSILSFVEEFGGSVSQVHRLIDGVAETKREADRAYLGEDYDRCLALMEQAVGDQEGLMTRALQAKDTALLWVYATEWSALMATFLLSGVVIWSLMVKRRLYKEVGSSRGLSDMRTRG
jgi:hypothetical protein